jgi:hypothetical protein
VRGFDNPLAHHRVVGARVDLLLERGQSLLLSFECRCVRGLTAPIQRGGQLLEIAAQFGRGQHQQVSRREARPPASPIV